jgi:hypothetical protein
MDELITCVAVCEDCTIYPSQAEEFLQWGSFLGKFYRDYKGLIRQHQIFRCTSAMIQESELYVEFRQSLRDEDEDEPKLVNVTKSNWVGKEGHEHEGVAFDYRPDEMQEQSIPAVKLAPLNIYKQFEMWSKWGQYVPKEVAEKEEIYKQPDTDTLKKILKEKGVRNELTELLADLKGLDGIADEVGDHGGIAVRGQRVVEKTSVVDFSSQPFWYPPSGRSGIRIPPNLKAYGLFLAVLSMLCLHKLKANVSGNLLLILRGGLSKFV